MIPFLSKATTAVLILIHGIVAHAQPAQMRGVDETRPEVSVQRLQEGGFALKASVRIAAPVKIVWDVLSDCGHALRYVPGMRLCKVLESGPDYDVARHRIRRYRLLPAVDYVFRSDYRPYDSVDVQLLEGDLEQLNGRWLFNACGEACTVLSYDFTIEAGWLVPGSLERKALRDDVPEMLKRLREQSQAWYAQAQAFKSRNQN